MTDKQERFKLEYRSCPECGVRLDSAEELAVGVCKDCEEP